MEDDLFAVPIAQFGQAHPQRVREGVHEPGDGEQGCAAPQDIVFEAEFGARALRPARELPHRIHEHVRCAGGEGQQPTGEDVAVSHRHDPYGDLFPGPQCRGGGAFVNEDRRVAAQEIGGKEGLPGRDLARYRRRVIGDAATYSGG